MSILELGLSRAIVGLRGPVLQSDEVSFLQEARPFGVILFSRNIDTPDQLKALTAAIRESVDWHMPIFIDQEGGRVARLEGPYWPEFPPALDQMQAVTDGQDERAMWLRGALIGHMLAEVGIDVNCTPLADVLTDHSHPILANRLYGRDAATVVRAAKALDAGSRAAGVASVLKHIPGYGRATLDGHEALTVVDDRISALRDQDFAPFAALHDMPMGMTAHIAYSAIDGRTPATFSMKIINLIRSEIGFGGLLMSDDISMGALEGDAAMRAYRTISAGVDIVLHCNGDLAEMEAVVDTAGKLGGATAARAQIAIDARPKAEDLDWAALRAEYSALMPGWPR